MKLFSILPKPNTPVPNNELVFVSYCMKLFNQKKYVVHFRRGSLWKMVDGFVSILQYRQLKSKSSILSLGLAYKLGII